jgi:4-amino-4-deoxy-L-arabinose transferase-like glycosyltransferase
MNAEKQLSAARVVLWIAAVFAVLYLPWLASEPAHVGLESTRALVARDMWRSGDWIVPTQNGAVYLAKPPVGYWMFALGSLPFGAVTVVSTRLVSALATLVLALAMALFMRRHVGAKVGLWSGIALIGCGLFLEKGMRAELEAPLALFTGLATLALFDTVWCERGRAWRVVSTGVLLGLALLVKGPIAWLIFALSLAGLAIAAPGRRKRALADGALALVVSIVVGLAWFVPLAERVGGEASFAKFVEETFKRLHDPGVTNREAFWFYVPALIAAFAPMTLLLPALVAKQSPARRGNPVETSLFALLVGWALGTTVFLSLSVGKETRYLMAVLPGWAMLAAWAWFREDRARWFELYRAFVLRLVAIVTWIAPLAVVIAGSVLRPAALAWTVTAALIVLAGRILAEVGLRRHATALLSIGILAGLFGLRLGWAKTWMANTQDSYPVEAIGAAIRSHVSVGEPLVELVEYKSDIQFAADRHFRIAANRDEIAALLAPADPSLPRAHYVLARTKDLPEGDERGLVEVAQWPFGSVHYRLLRAP